MILEIKTDEIDYAERILLRNDEKFDVEQKAFISNYNTIDLQAVPGSGKTSALLAKLLILEKRLPFNDGSGILVLSHTNAAIDEIESKIKKHCPKLFNYPNFVGTIQAFVDKYFATPFYVNRYKQRPISIDDIDYNEQINKWFNILSSKAGDELKKKLWHIKKSSAKNLYSEVRFGIEDGKLVLLKRLNSTKMDFSKPRGKTRNYVDYSDEIKNVIYKWVIQLKKIVFEKGRVLHYDDAYFLAELYFLKYPRIIETIRKRFCFVFVDEMQDMGPHQISLLDKLFFNPTEKDYCFQRIGDRNQAIYYPGDFDEDIYWNSQDREFLSLSVSRRLSPKIATIVEKFGIESVRITGANSNIVLPPMLLLYNSNKVQSVLPLFSRITKEFLDEHPELYSEKIPIKAIGWRKETDEGTTLVSYFPSYISISSDRKQNGKSIWAELNEAYLLSQKHMALKHIYRAIWKFFYTVISMENYSKFESIKSINLFQDHFKVKDGERFHLTEEMVYDWCFRLVCGEIDTVYSEIINYIKEVIIELFGVRFNYSRNYIENKQFEQRINSSGNENIFKDSQTSLEFEVCTVHSTKGQTHLATLYLESYYYNDAGKSYESQRLHECFRGSSFNKIGKRNKQSTKMVFVGLSRAKYLLCYAANSNHFTEEDLTQIAAQGWEINRELCN